jgi:diguanylate cyclase (GGDEF)-like protein
VINGLILNIAALGLHAGVVFAAFAAIDLVLVIIRIRVVRLALNAAENGRPTPTDLYLLTATCWYALLGAMAFMATYSAIVPLQLLAITYVVGMVGPICARNYPAPRYALMAVILCELPLVIGAGLSGSRWMLIMVLQTPLFLYGAITVIRRFQTIAVAALRSEHESSHRARHDPLTGLINRLGLDEALNAANDRFTLYYLDLDGFKTINDNFGHAAGDKVLNAVAVRLLSVVRSDDIVSRLGGDEFVILAPNMSPPLAALFAGRIVRVITDEPYVFDKIGSLSVGVSVGFVCVPEDARRDDDLLQKTDAALYEAKAAGKGAYRRYSISQPPLPGRIRRQA